MSCEWGAACWRGRTSEGAMFTPPSSGPKMSPISVTVAVTTVMRIQSRKFTLEVPDINTTKDTFYCFSLRGHQMLKYFVHPIAR